MRTTKNVWVVCAATLGLALPLAAQQIQVSKDNKTIAITTSDEASAVADTAVVSIGFQSYGKEQQETYDDAARTSNAIVSALTAAGISKDAIESADQGISPLEPMGDENKARYAQGLRFQFHQGWRVTVGAADAAKVLQTAVTAGANNSGDVEWRLKDDQVLLAQAAQKALQHAQEIASSMAAGLKVRLGPLVYASNQVPERPMPIAMARMESLSAPAKIGRPTQPLAMSAQKVSRSATVYAVFAVE